ncbi:MAG: hypothetical protein GX660_13130 [Clostridiaceae bacterium]|nr:hypothetical protein [Clostridiaceae bacterium]
MKLKEIEIINYKALYGLHKINLTNKGKNLMLYGENGSGKSSVCKALKTFFQSSVSEIDILKDENVFLAPADRGNGFIKLTFGNQGEARNNRHFTLDATNKRLNEQFISEANKIKGFLDYKQLLRTHFINGDQVNVFELLVEDLLTDAINPITTNPIKTDWADLQERIKENRNTRKYKDIIDANLLSNFNTGLNQLLTEIETKANEIIDLFKYNVKIHFKFNNITIGSGKGCANKNIFLQIDFFNQPRLPKHHHFLNEARLTAISIAIYLGSVLNSISGTQYKILVLDDIFIGLDTSNRIHFLEVLSTKFSDYQIIMTTYDKYWYEVVKQTMGEGNWHYAEMYVKEEHQNGFEIPIINEMDFIAQAEYYLNQKADLKASAVYIRSAFEQMLKNYCSKYRCKVDFNLNPSKVSAEILWNSVKNNTKTDGSRRIPETLRDNIETQRTLVMNPFVHYDITRPQFRAELTSTIAYVKQLQTELNS